MVVSRVFFSLEWMALYNTVVVVNKGVTFYVLPGSRSPDIFVSFPEAKHCARKLFAQPGKSVSLILS